MVTHLREFQSPTGILCCRPAGAGDARVTDPEKVDCPRCVEVIKIAHERRDKSYSLAFVGPGGSTPLDFQGADERPASPARRSDAQLLDLLAKARAQGVHRLEVRADGSFTAEITPPPPPPAPEPKQLTRAEQEAADEAALLGRVLR
jgi:hypothetical protein